MLPLLVIAAALADTGAPVEPDSPPAEAPVVEVETVQVVEPPTSVVQELQALEALLEQVEADNEDDEPEPELVPEE